MISIINILRFGKGVNGLKIRSLSKRMRFALILALILILVGMVWGIQTFSALDRLASNHEDHDTLVSSVRLTAFYCMLCGSMVAAGIIIVLVLFWHLSRRALRLRQEAAALQKRADAMEALNKETRELAHHQRLETIGTLTSSIAHEFNNLLTPIMGYSLLALEKLPPEEEALYDDILEIYTASRKAKDIISRLSDLSRKNTSTTFHVACPDDLVRKMLDVANPALPKKVEVVADLNCWDQRFSVNEIQISQLLLNLILNGFQAMEDTGGVLTVHTSYDENSIHIQVQDTGCGIPKENMDKLLEPFFTTKETGKGTGLGLAIVAQVVEDHHGQLRFDSQEGNGTRVCVVLPRWTES